MCNAVIMVVFDAKRGVCVKRNEKEEQEKEK